MERREMSEPITITATVAAWLPSHKMPHELIDLLGKGDATRVINALHLYGSPASKEFGDCPRVGTAEVTLTLLPADEQVRMAVEGLQKKLQEERAESQLRQQAILEAISKISALTYEVPA
jgi:hypothetical protein